MNFSKSHVFIAAAVLAGAVASAAVFGYTTRGAFSFIAICVLVDAAVTDMRIMEIPDRDHIILIILGLAAALLIPGEGFTERAAGLLAVSLPMIATDIAAPGSFGGGDIKLCASFGFFMGWKALLAGTAAAVTAGGIFAASALISGKLEKDDHFAFGPFLAAGMIIAVFLGDKTMSFVI